MRAPITPDDPRHGKQSGYAAGCHEACCRRPHATYRRSLDVRTYLAGGPMLTDPTGTIRRLQALAALGYTFPQISRALGHEDTWANQLTRRNRPLHRRNAQKVARLFDAWSMEPAPKTRYAARTRRYAKVKGWAPPLAWDDNTIDDPNAVPHIDAPRDRDYVDEVSVRRLLNGERVDCTPAEREEVIRRWLADGRSVNELDRLTGWNVRRMLRLRRLAESGSAAA